MSKRRRGRITVQHQPTGASRAAMRGMGIVHAIFGGVFAFIALTAIIPTGGIIGLPFLAAGLFFCINGIRMAVSKNGMAHRVAYDVESGVEEDVICGLLEEPPTEFVHNAGKNVENNPVFPSFVPDPKTRLEQLESLKTAGLITEREYKEKRSEILDSL